MVVIVARVYKQRLISRFRREVAAASAAARHPDQHPSFTAADHQASRPQASIQHIGDRRFYVVPERDVSVSRTRHSMFRQHNTLVNIVSLVSATTFVCERGTF